MSDADLATFSRRSVIVACCRTMPGPALSTCAGDQNICVVGTMVVSVHLAVLVPGRPFPVIRLPLPGPQKAVGLKSAIHQRLLTYRSRCLELSMAVDKM